MYLHGLAFKEGLDVRTVEGLVACVRRDAHGLAQPARDGVGTAKNVCVTLCETMGIRAMARSGPKPKPGCCGTKFSANPQAGSETKKCLRTRKVIPIACFDLNPKTGTLYGSCVVCIAKNRAQHTAYGKTDGGKAKRKIQNDKQSTKDLKKAYRDSDAGKAKTKANTSSAEYLEKCSKFSKTSAGKSIRKNTYEKHRLSNLLLNGFARIMRGGCSPKFVAHSSFSNDAHVRNHMRKVIAGTAMQMHNYGKNWGCEHKIPRSAYDHDDAADVKRCWSPANMHAMTHKENKEKSTEIVAAIVDTVPQEYWPKAWEGRMPLQG